MTWRWTIAVAATALAACGGGNGSDSEPDAGTTTPPNTTTVPTTSSPAGDDDPSTTAADAGDGTTSTLVPSPGADLPTGPPPSAADGQPATTIAGPLPEPTVALLDVARFERPVEGATRELDGRLFVVEQGGRVFAIDDISRDEVLDISDLVTTAGNEQGLLGLAFHPERDLAYVDYTDRSGTTVIAEFAVDPVTAVFDRESLREVLRVEQPFANHNGGEIAFGPDGHLYIGLGDGGAADDPNRVALDLSSRLGKLLRIDPLESGDQPFSVPAGNPYVDAEGADPTVWASGLRNPWKFSFDPATGDLWIADVGQNEREEIDRAPAADGRNAGRGLSFGWSAFEGTAPYNADQPADGHVAPVVEYLHEDRHCSVSGGAVYRGAQIPDLAGWYVYADHCSGQVWGYDTTSPADAPRVVELGEVPGATAIVAGPEGELFAMSLDGFVSRFIPG